MKNFVMPNRKRIKDRFYAIGTVVDVYPASKTIRIRGFEQDAKLMSEDWRNVGQFIKQATDQFISKNLNQYNEQIQTKERDCTA